MEETSVNQMVNIEPESSCCYEGDTKSSTNAAQPKQQQQQPIELPENSQTIQQDINNDNKEKQLDELEVVKKICPLMKHHQNTTQNTTSPLKVVCGQKIHPSNYTRKSLNNNTSGQLDRAGFKSSMAAVARLIGAQQNKMANSKSAKKPTLLRQINIVGQLNHSVSKGLILITMDFAMIFTILVSVLLLGFNSQPAQSVVWPFNKSSQNNQPSNSPASFVASLTLSSLTSPLLSSSLSSNKTSGSSKRSARNSGISNQAAANQIGGLSSTTNNNARLENQQQQPVVAPISQQFHYFWNHDQIDPKLMASEASKILADAQVQTDQISLSNNIKNIRRNDNSQPILLDSDSSLISANNGFDQSSQSHQNSDNNMNKKENNNMALATDPLAASSSSQQSTQVAPPGTDQSQVPIMIPPAIQQQLTSMVLAMQRQQQMSMMMQPRFDAPIQAAASRRFFQGHSPATHQSGLVAPILPFNPLNRYWMAAASSQHPVIAPPPPHMLNSPHNMISAESIQGNQLVNGSPFGHQMMAAADIAARAGTATANIAGVPVFGPFMVAPSTASLHHHQPTMFNPAMFMTTSQTTASNSKQQLSPSSTGSGLSSQLSSASGRLASSLLSRRKSWPLFNFGSHLTDRGSLFSSASQLRPTISLPPNQLQQQSQRNPISMASLPTESMAYLDAASNQLASAILSQVQARAAEQKLASALAQAIQQEQKVSQDMQSLDSIQSGKTVNIAIGQKPDQTFQAPYMISPTGLTTPSSSPVVFNPITQQFSVASNQMFKPYQPFEFIQANQSSSSAFNSIPFGSRLKRRHLNTFAKSMSSSPAIKHVHMTMPSNINHAISQDDFKTSSSAAMNFNDLTNTNKKMTNPPYTVLNSDQEKTWLKIGGTNEKQQQQQQQQQAVLDMDSDSSKQTQNFNNFHNTDIYETLASSVPATPTRVLAPTQQPPVVKATKNSQQQQQKRIVKKEVSSLAGSKKSTKHAAHDMQQQQVNSGTSPSSESNLRHLFMLMATESPPTKHSTAMIDYDSGEQTQLRRLKRSISAPEATINKELAEKSKEKDYEFGKRQPRSLLRSPSSNSWVSMTSSSENSSKLGDKQVSAVGMATSQQQSSKTQTNIYPSTSYQTWKPQTLATKWAIAKTDSSSSSGWIGGNGLKTETKADSGLLKRQAELADQNQLISSSSSSKSVTVVNPETTKQAKQQGSSSGAENTTSGEVHQKSASQEPRQAKFLKIKRVTASASVLHHPISSKSHEKSKSLRQATTQHQRGTVLAEPKSHQEKAAVDDLKGAVDPMSSSVSESARVVNYFQNVDNDEKSAPESQQKQQQQQQQQVINPPNLPQTIQSPQINLAYSAPTKQVIKQNDNNIQSMVNYAPEQDLKRQQSTQQASEHSGNKVAASSSTYSGSFSPTYIEQPMQGLMSSSSLITAKQAPRLRSTNSFQNINQNQQQQQQVQQQLSQVSANNGDISSAATAGNLAYVKSFPSSSMNPHYQQQQANRQVGTMTSMPVQSSNIINNSNSKSTPNSFGLSRSFIGNLLSNLDGAMQRSSSSTSGIVGPIFGATSHSRQTVMTPSGKSVDGQQQQQVGSGSSSSSSTSYSDRTTSADQSNSYNEELLPPQSSASPPSSSSSQSLGMFGNSMSNVDIPGPISSQSDLQHFDSSPLNGGGQQQSQQQQQQQQNIDLNNQFNDNNNFVSNSKTLESSIDIDPTRYSSGQQQNGHQQQQQLFAGSSPFNQTDSYVPDTPDSAVLYGSGGSPMFGSGGGGISGQSSFQSQPSLMPHNPMGDSSQLLNQQQASQQMSLPNQLYTHQQLNALNAAVVDYNNQQRFNQHQFNQDNSIGNFNSRARAAAAAAMFPTTSSLINQQSINTYQQIPAQNLPQQLYQNAPVDEEAAAGTLAAAGIPTYPSAVQLLAMQSQAPLNEFNGMLVAASNKREQDDGDSQGSQKSSSGKKKNKQGGAKQGVSHHYHFNNLANPFEDPDGFAPISPLEIVGNGQYGFQPASNKQKKVKKEKDSDNEEEKQKGDEEKPKKKGFLRRFSLKNLFKRFRKDKKKEVESGGDNQDKENGGTDSTSER